MFETLAEAPVTPAIGLALVHFVWQGTAIALVTASLFHALRHASASSAVRRHPDTRARARAAPRLPDESVSECVRAAMRRRPRRSFSHAISASRSVAGQA